MNLEKDSSPLAKTKTKTKAKAKAETKGGLSPAGGHTFYFLPKPRNYYSLDIVYR